MELNRKNIKTLLGILTFGIILFWCAQNFASVSQTISHIGSVISPLIAGLCIAFVINVPMGAFERFFKKKHMNGKMRCERWKSAVRPVSLLLSVLVIVIILIFVLTMIVPQIVETIAQLTEAAVRFVPQAQEFFNDLRERLTDYPDYQKVLDELVPDWYQMLGQMGTFLRNFSVDAIIGSIGAATSIFSGVINAFVAIVFAVYVVTQKETLSVQARRFIYAFFPEKAADDILHVARLSYKTFYTFVTVQCMEAAILASLCFVGMTIFRFPYAVMISVLMFVMALIPIFGAIISLVVGAFFILMVDPMKALWFVIFILVLQQVEGNLIYPRVVSSSFGLSPMWVMVAVTLGGNLFGLAGLLVSVPTTCVIYTLVQEAMKRRLDKKQIDKRKLQHGRKSGA